MVEHIDNETANIVADPTVDSRIRVTTISWFSEASATGIMALVTPMAHYIGPPVIRKTSLKGIRGVTVAAIAGGIGMIRHSLLSSGGYAVVTARTTGGYAGMVKSPVCL